MILGTGSHVGKSLITTALCRIFHRHGIRVAPFKSQNMSLNSAATPEGLEIGRAQALQAEAAGIPASVDMNPILLKPSGNMSSQVVVRGRIWGQLSAWDYHQRRVEELMPIVRESYGTLAAAHELILLEGAGSPAEINLKQHDIVNMRMAEMADAACLLVGDIDRGGVFASLLGTLLLLDEHERARVCGTIINKFRGDRALLEPGLAMLEQRTAKPCLGVVPWRPRLQLDEEDSLGLPEESNAAWPDDPSPKRQLRVAVIALPSLANFTDFDALRSEPAVDVRFVRTPVSLAKADVVVLPGSKQTAADLEWMRAEGLLPALEEHARHKLIIGICGGLQMLGQTIADPEGIEGGGVVSALGLLPIRTVMHARKTTELARGRVASSSLFAGALTDTFVGGYEIHVGRTEYLEGSQPFAHLHSGRDGCVAASGRVFGTYLHGIFDEDAFRHALVACARASAGLAGAEPGSDWKQSRERALDDWATHVEDALDMPRIFALAGFAYVPARPA
jgi:adenosylcobyric acid synthase